MPTTGPWIQDDDYEYTAVTSDGNQWGQRSRQLTDASLEAYPMREAGYQDEELENWYSVPDERMTELMSAAPSALVKPYLQASYVGALRGTEMHRFHGSGTFGQRNWSTGATAVVALYPWLILQEIPGLHVSPDSAWPEGAYDLEWEDGEGFAEWTGVRLDGSTAVEGWNSDFSNLIEQPLSDNRFRTDLMLTTATGANGTPGEAGGAPATPPYAGGAVLTSLYGQTEPTTIGEDIDLTQHLADTYTGLVVYTQTRPTSRPSTRTPRACSAKATGGAMATGSRSSRSPGRLGSRATDSSSTRRPRRP